MGVAVAVSLGLFAGAFVAAWFLFPFPLDRLDNQPISPTVTDRNGRILLQCVGPDDQWRFPVELDQMSPWLIKATVATEDSRFREHHGVDVKAVCRAAWQNIAARRTVSGASTLTMQVCRQGSLPMMDAAAVRAAHEDGSGCPGTGSTGRRRTLVTKAVEAFRALQLERLRSKDEILKAYLNMAPYGRNLRGVEAAARAWFGKHARDLSLGESALLAGLPQSPSRYRPDRFPESARARRLTVLRQMLDRGMITAEQRDRAAAEPLPNAECRVPSAKCENASGHSLGTWHLALGTSSHAAWMALARRPRGGQTTLDADIQAQVVRLVGAHSTRWPAGTDVSIVVMDVACGDIIALVGSRDPTDPSVGAVCGATAWRSPGSALKPFVYAAAFETRRAGPDSTVYDICIERAGWSPNNFDGKFAGELPAAEALRRSLNVPAILLAENVGLGRCVGLMRAAGLQFRGGPEARGGLATVVGAVEVRLLDLVTAYATIARGGIRKPARLFMDESADGSADPVRVIDANVCATIDYILSSRARRPAGLDGLTDEQVPWFMWKTGTSSGRRDAWAVGHNRRLAIGVWIGRFAGGGDPAFVGGELAEPLAAQLFALPALGCQGSSNDADPPPPRAWTVTSPWPRPSEIVAPLQIAFPPPGSRFLAVRTAGAIGPRPGLAQAVIHPRVNVGGPRPLAPGGPGRATGLYWFLNGRLLGRDESSRLLLPPGRYELRCTASSGNASAVKFDVR